mgnify:CR=1 FL=1
MSKKQQPQVQAVETIHEMQDELPYDEPISDKAYERDLEALQIELLKRHRAGESDARIAEGIQLSINAIATALRNSG